MQMHKRTSRRPPKGHEDPAFWREAIADAEREIQKAKSKIARLERAISLSRVRVEQGEQQKDAAQ